MADSAVTMNISKEIIDAHVKAAVASVLNKDPEALIRAVVTSAMNERDRNSYNSSDKSIWDQQVNRMIREVAQATFNEWLEEQKPAIAKLVRAKLTERNGRKTIDDIVEKLTTALGRFQVSVHLGE